MAETGSGGPGDRPRLLRPLPVAGAAARLDPRGRGFDVAGRAFEREGDGERAQAVGRPGQAVGLGGQLLHSELCWRILIAWALPVSESCAARFAAWVICVRHGPKSLSTWAA